MKKFLTIFLSVLLASGSCFALTYDMNSLSTGNYTEANFNLNFVGVSFDNTGGNVFDVQTVSGGLLADFSGNAILNTPHENPGNRTRATFTIPTGFASVTMGDYDADADVLNLIAYNSSDVVMASQSYNLPSDSYAGITLTVSVPNISYVEFYGVGVNNNSVYWDNFSFDAGSSAVPEPATMLLLGVGLIGLAGFRSRKFKSN